MNTNIDGYRCAEEMSKDGCKWDKIISLARDKALSGKKRFADGVISFIENHMPEAHSEQELRLWERVNSLKNRFML